MEKFTNWRDKGTGIGPFLPPRSPKGGSIMMDYVFIVYGIIKSVLLLPLVLGNLVVDSIYMWEIILSVLFGSGCKIDLMVDGRKLKRQNEQKGNILSKGVIYMVNFTSIIDAMILKMICGGQNFRILVPNENGKFFQLGLIGLVKFTKNGSLDVERYGNEISNIEKELDKYIWFMFPEGTTSNGKSVLPFVVTSANLNEVIYGDDEMKPVKVSSIRIKVNQSLTTPLRVSLWSLIKNLFTKKISVKCNVHKVVILDRDGVSLDTIRVQLNGEDSFKLVSKSLNIDSKRRFVEEYFRK
ncbi:hypothetical protein KAFR_0B06570 [Kazachstania africana CBS 2517]|uniref:Phospholipid/glycerol acyltransferase domain-containing protein n=1 Tax=Kazachstania africana (strain ATCC 22294 / BCRC 22015 / CBS 2517 / CECT 1963 / NBRC 1671 / NRRL Y-8276) TaxID=1071382 RepID=H2ARF3_KAZAF|nr:hypothetical protein KAFR_0B06570 [Kazachstania africana CBS 2517]CCF56953.1 hypothetical protein KAFR_0B06570 [Kazachstania africana CBS 2517]